MARDHNGERIMTEAPCVKRFELLTVEIGQMGLNPRKRYAVCTDDARPNAGRGVVCPCNGCNSRCKGYTPEDLEYSDPDSSD